MGLLLAQGLTAQQAVDTLGHVAEGVYCARTVLARADALQVDMPITRCVVALLDGTQVDDGTAWEIGYFFSRKSAGQTIIGIRTDFRKAGESATAIVNAMIEMACDRIVHDRDDLVGVVLQALGLPSTRQR